MQEKERAVLVGVELARPKIKIEETMSELRSLTDTAGAEIIGEFIQQRSSPDPAYFIGQGKAREIYNFSREEKTDLVIFDEELSATQQRNLEDILETKVIDRPRLILDIFSQRARTREGQLQVELARLQYLLPRLTGKEPGLAQQKGIGFRGGAGEKKLEVDRRKIRDRINFLEKQIDKIKDYRQLQRKKRKRLNWPLISLVGYTNSGKSTLLNTLTGADVFVENKLFATLDPTTRKLSLPSGRKALLTDTVGFIRKLPPQLVAAFRATLEEVQEADILVNVVDLSSEQSKEKMLAVQEILKELGVQNKPVLTVYNKADLLEDGEDINRRLNKNPEEVVVSALKRKGIEELLYKIEEFLPSLLKTELLIPYEKYSLFTHLFQNGNILEKEYRKEGIKTKVEVDKELWNRIKKYQLS